MTSNTHPDMHGSEPDEHYAWCPALCEYDLPPQCPACELGFSNGSCTCGLDVHHCQAGHTSHDCTCDEPPDEDYSDDD